MTFLGIGAMVWVYFLIGYFCTDYARDFRPLRDESSLALGCEVLLWPLCVPLRLLGWIVKL